MRIYYLIQAHYMPSRFHSLVDALAGPDSHIVAHIDAKTDAAPFSQMAGVKPVTFVPDAARVPVLWKGWSQVTATLAMMRIALRDAASTDYLILLSGDSYPLRKEADIGQYLNNAGGAQFLNGLRMPVPHKPIERISRYHFEYNRRDDKKHWLARNLNRLEIPRDYDTALSGRLPYAGSSWWGLTADAASYVLDQATKDKRFVRLARHSLCPDEFFVQTLLFNSHFLDEIRPAFMYTDWSRPKPRPAHIDADHVRHLSTNPLCEDTYGSRPPLFARKVTDDNVAALIRDELWPLATQGSG